MKIPLIAFINLLLLASCSVRKTETPDHHELRQILHTLSADDMQGRGLFTTGIEKAAVFIENEFKKIGLQPLPGESSFRQRLDLIRLRPSIINIIIDGNKIDEGNVMVITNQASLNWNAGIEIIKISAAESFFNRYRTIMQLEQPVLVLVSEQHAHAFKRLQARMSKGRIISETASRQAAVFILGIDDAKDFSVNFTNQIEKLPLSNMAAMLPGKSKEKELVIFSGHYDHLGIIESAEGDSIANGADDDASGITAVIALAQHFKKLNNNERTILFVAFTAEEIGGFGSRHFSKKLNPDDVVALFNIEMIGKRSKFGSNAAFITGYEKSDFGEILQKNLTDTEFKFYPDPYPEQNLFYRSDNATLAALGVPAHTISTDQIDKDLFYHTVNDELETLDLNNIAATIKAIALSARSIIAGTDTPKRIPKLENAEH